MKKTGLLLLLITTLNTTAFAATDENIVLVKRPADQVYEDSSEANRINKKGMVGIELFGMGPNYFVGSGIVGGINLNRNQQLLIEARSGKGGLVRSYTATDAFGSYSGSSETKVNLLGVHLKTFTGNSFYVRFGADYGKVDYNYDENFGSATSKFGYSFSGEALTGNVIIGNQWQWTDFTLGCDWIGLTTPLYHRVTSEKIIGNKMSQAYELKRDQEAYLNRSELVALRFYLGTSF